MNTLKKNMNKKGFTLAELLIVVAIIAVLVAISIPIFTSQLEKSKEATDIANIRSYYAEITTGLLTGDLTKANDTVTVGNNLTAKLSANLPTTAGETFTVVVSGVTFKQSVAAWQTADFDIAGVKKASVAGWASTHNQITYTFKLTTDGDYVLTGVETGASS